MHFLPTMHCHNAGNSNSALCSIEILCWFVILPLLQQTGELAGTYKLENGTAYLEVLLNVKDDPDMPQEGANKEELTYWPTLVKLPFDGPEDPGWSLQVWCAGFACETRAATSTCAPYLVSMR